MLLTTSGVRADCAPAPSADGETITCTGADTDGLDAGGFNNLTVNVQPGASVSNTAPGDVINLLDRNVVTNAGSITVDPGGYNGILAVDNNVVTNNSIIAVGDGSFGIGLANSNTVINNVTITLGQNATGISIGDNSAVTNNGLIDSAGLSGGTGIYSVSSNNILNNTTGVIVLGNEGKGIYAAGGGSTITNLGSIAVGNSFGFGGGIVAIGGLGGGYSILNALGATINAGANATGILLQADDSTITNNGLINTGAGGIGIYAQGNNVSIVSTGTLTSGASGGGIAFSGDNSTIFAAGTITAGDAGIGILANGSNNTITNASTMTLGADGAGIYASGDRVTIINRGTITVGDGSSSVGISLSASSSDSGNRVINLGTINVGTDGVGIEIDFDGSIYNDGKIDAPTGFAAIHFCNCSSASSLTLGTNSVINGFVLGSGTQVLNLGGSIGTGTFDLGQIGSGLQYDGFATFNKIDTSHWILIGTGNQDWNVLGGMLTLNGTINGQVAVSNSTFTVNGAVNGGVSVISGVLNANGTIAGAVTAASSTLSQNTGAVIGGDVVLDASTFTTGGTVAGSVTATGSTLTQNAGGRIGGGVTLNASAFTTSGTVTGLVTVTNSTLTQNAAGAIDGGVILKASTATLNGIVNNAVTANMSTLSQSSSGVINGTVTLTDSRFASNGSVNGAVVLNGGALTANGRISGAVTINGGGLLAGTGTVGSTTINNGTLSPGNSIGTLTVQGNLVLSSAAVYIVEIGGTASDRTNVSGTATVAGTVQAAFAGPLVRRFTIVSANGGVIGTFGTLTTTSLPTGFAARLTYDPNNAYVDLTAVLGTGQGLNQNQQNVATSLNTYFNGSGTLSERFGALFALTGDRLRSALSQLSGEIATQSAQAAFSSVDYFLNLMLDPFVTSRGGDAAGAAGANNFADAETEASAYAAKRKRSAAEQDAYAAMARKAVARNNLLDPRWSVWGAGYGGELKAGGNPGVGSRDASTRAFGFAVGADYRFSPDTLAGFALSGGGTTFSLAQSAGNGRSDVFQAGAFVRHNFGQGYIKGAVAYGWHDVTTERTVVLSGIDKLEGRYNANSFAARGEGGYRFVTPWMGVTPYAAAQSITYFQPSYGDQVNLGLNAFALTYAARDITSARSELGLRTDKSFVLQTALVTLRGRAAWAHYFDGNRALTASFQALSAPAFVVTGAAQARDAALVSASADAKWANGVSVAGVFEGEFSDQTRGYAGKGIVRYQW